MMLSARSGAGIYERILEKRFPPFCPGRCCHSFCGHIEPVEEILMISELLGDIPAPDNIAHPRGVTD